jgi:hypothetical protein
MTKILSKTARKRMAKRRHLIGSKGVDKQRARHARGRIKAVAKGIVTGDIPTAIHKADTKETIQRVADYKAGAKKKGITSPRARKKQRDYKAPTHGRRKK